MDAGCTSKTVLLEGCVFRFPVPNTDSKYTHQIMQVMVDLSITVAFMVPSNDHVQIYHVVIHMDQQ